MLNKTLKIYYILLVLFFLSLITFIFLSGLEFNKFNFWIDNLGYLVLDNSILRYLFVWDDNLLGSFWGTLPISLPSIFIIYIIYSIFSIKYGTYLVLFFFIFIINISGYLLTNKILKSEINSLIISPIFIFNPIVLWIFYGPNTTTFLMAFAGLLLGFLFLYGYQKSYRNISLVGIVLSSLLITHPFFFSFYFFIIAYLLIWEKRFLQTGIILFTMILLNLFWILPFISTYLFKEPSIPQDYSTNLIDVYVKGSSVAYPFVFLNRSFDFIKSLYGNFDTLVIIIFFLLWGLLILGSILAKKRVFNNIKYILLILILFLFSFGPVDGIGFLFKYTLENIPGFFMFRSYQNVLLFLFGVVMFYILILSKYNRYILRTLQVISIMSLIMFISAKDIKVVDRSTDIPDEYFQVQKIVNQDKVQNKVLLLPLSEYDYYSWDKYQDKYFLEAFFNKGIIYYRPTLSDKYLESKFNQFTKSESGIIDQKELQKMNVKYILNRKDMIDFYTPLKNEISGEKIFTSEYIDLYKIEGTLPIIEADNASFYKINPTKYKVQLDNLDQVSQLDFLNKKNIGWKLYLNPINSNTKDCNVIQEYNNEGKNIKECEHTQKFFEGEELSYLWRQPVFEDSHQLVYDYANQWTIDPEYIKANFDKSMYKENPDGSIDLELTLYFKPQSYFYLGIIISGTTLTLCLGYLGYAFYRQRKKK
jgi:hypothetical protein